MVKTNSQLFVAPAGNRWRTRTHVRVGGIERQRSRGFDARIVRICFGMQHFRACRSQVGAVRIEVDGMIRSLERFLSVSLAHVYGSQAHPVVGVAFLGLQNFVELVFRFREAAGPGQDLRVPCTDIQVAGEKRNLLIYDAQGVAIVASVRVFANLRLPRLFP